MSLLQTPGGRRFVSFLHQLARHVAERVADRLGQGHVGLTFDPVDAVEEEGELKSRTKAYRMAKQVRDFVFLGLVNFCIVNTEPATMNDGAQSFSLYFSLWKTVV